LDLSRSTVYNLQSGYTKGSTTVTTTSAHGLNEGEIVVIDQLNSDLSDPPVTITDSEGCSQNCGRSVDNIAVRSFGQVNRIKSVLSSTQVELEIPLYYTFNAGLNPQIVTVPGLLSGVGIENLTIDNTTSVSGTAFSFNGAHNSWALRVEVIAGPHMLIRMAQTYRNTLRNCIFHGNPGVVVPVKTTV